MIRKTVLAVAAIATVGVAALAPTTASATYYGHGYGHRSHYGFYGHRNFYAHRHYVPTYSYCTIKKVWNDYTYSWDFVKVC